MQSAVKKLSEIGTGAFGEVWLGYNSTFGKVAVKTIKVWSCLLCLACTLACLACQSGVVCVASGCQRDRVLLPLSCLVLASTLPGHGSGNCTGLCGPSVRLTDALSLDEAAMLAAKSQ